MPRYGISIDLGIEELSRITDPDVILGLWTAAEVKDAEELGQGEITSFW